MLVALMGCGDKWKLVGTRFVSVTVVLADSVQLLFCSCWSLQSVKGEQRVKFDSRNFRNEEVSSFGFRAVCGNTGP